MFESNSQVHRFKQVLEILQHTRLLEFFFSPVFACMSFLNKDRLGMEISYFFGKINIFFCNGERI